MTTYAIGDIHGALHRLRMLLRRLDDVSHLVFMGDYLDKGENSKDVIETIRMTRERIPCTMLMGNHEFLWLDHIDGADRSELLGRTGARETFAAYLGRPVAAEELPVLFADRRSICRMFGDHLAFLRELAAFAAPVGTRAVCVHGGIAPDFGDRDLADHDLEKLVFLRFGRTAVDAHWRERVVVMGHTVVGPRPMSAHASIGIDTGAWMDEGRLTALDLSSFGYVQDDGTRGQLTLERFLDV